MRAAPTGVLHHVEIYVSELERSVEFWGWLLDALGYSTYQQWSTGHSWLRESTYVVLVQAEKDHLAAGYHRKRVGLNHVAFHAASSDFVDALTAALRARGHEVLYDDRHPHAGGDDFYGVFFEDPDRIKIEVAAPSERTTDKRPTLTSERLVLRPFGLADASEVQRLAGDRRVAATTLHIPHPYPDGAAELWIGGHVDSFALGCDLTLAVTRDGALVGAVAGSLDPAAKIAIIGYWIAVEQWGKGYATEACRRLVDYLFHERDIERVCAEVFAPNLASARVLEKIGMQEEGRFRSHIVKWGERLDARHFGLLRGDWHTD